MDTNLTEKEVKNKEFSFKSALKNMGPAIIVAAGILGPGTVTTSSVYGSKYGYAGLWIVAMAVMLAIFYQEPAIRITNMDNDEEGQTVMLGIRNNISKPMAIILWITLLFGGVALQAGNLAGTSMALTYFFPGTSSFFWVCVISIVGFTVGWFGVYKIVENFNKVLIAAIILAFVLCAVYTSPNVGDLLTKGFTFNIAGGDYWTALALLSTTAPYHVVVGYSSLMKKRRMESNVVDTSSTDSKIRSAKFDLCISMLFAGLVTAAIIICAGTVMFPRGIEVKSAADMALQLTPLLGRFAGIVFSFGLFAAGFSTVLYQVTIQPYYMNEAFGRDVNLKSKQSRLVMASTGILPLFIIALFGGTPVSLIVTAQALTGLAYPLVVILVWILCNKKGFMGKYRNTKTQNAIYAVITLITTFLAIRTFLSLSGLV